MAGLKYNRVMRYDLTVFCDGPLRIGSAEGLKETVLVHPNSGSPFIQASSLAGALRSYGESLGMAVEALFGDSDNEEGMDSRVKFTDGIFSKNVCMELRPHVRIDRSTGSASSATVKGTKKVSGQKFNMEYVGAGQEFTFTILAYDLSQQSIESDLEILLSGLGSKSIRLGGKKSSGAGIVSIKNATKITYDLTNPEDLKAWIQNDTAKAEAYTKKLIGGEKNGRAYIVTINGKTEGGIQVKGLAENEFGKDATDSSNIMNARGEYIVPGSSFKGTTRAQMEKIAEYLGRTKLIEDIFGQVGSGEASGHAGNIFFRDAVIGDAEEIARIPRKHRVHIDKFTGGVMNPFQETNAAGTIEFQVEIANRNHPQETLAILLYAMRDLAIGTMSVGNGYANGKGMIDVLNISIEECATGNKAIIDYSDFPNIVDENRLIQSALDALKGGSR